MVDLLIYAATNANILSRESPDADKTDVSQTRQEEPDPNE